jgi:adenylate cyclase
MNKKVQVLLNWLAAPAAIGLYAAILVTILCFFFYAARDSGQKEKFWVNYILKAHQASIDYRLQVRGPRRGSPSVAILAVDEKAVETIGRWPWPRETLAKGIDRAFQYGAKVLAFDMVFSEPTNNVAQNLYSELHDKRGLSPEGEKLLQEAVKKLDSDAVLAGVFGKHADKVVAGSQFLHEEENPHDPGYLDFCYDLAFKKLAAAQVWNHEEVLLSPSDPYLQVPPRKLTELFATMLTVREDAVRKDFKSSGEGGPGAALSAKDKVELEMRVREDLKGACKTILDDFKDELESLWQTEIRPNENPAEFKFNTYAQWVADFKKHSIPNSITVAEDWNVNVPAIAQQTKHTAFYNTSLDNDGTIRTKRLIARFGKTYFPALSLKAFMLATNQNADIKIQVNPATARREITEFAMLDNDTGNKTFSIPTDGQGSLMINYAGPAKMFPHLSFAELMSDGDDAEIEIREINPATGHWDVAHEPIKKSKWLKDKIFVVGATATGIFDLRVTPFQKDYPGVETHADVISDLLTRNFMRPWDEERSKMPLMILVIGIAMSITLAQLGAIGGLLMTIMFLVVFWFVDKFYLFDHGIVVMIIWPFAMVGGVFVTMTFYRYLTEERGKKELRQTFAKYVSPAIVEEILADPKNIELGGRKTNLTVFFSDVRGFTTISEKLDPRALSDLLNSYLTPMTEIVFKNRGTLDKYMGDAVMAFFGAPIHYQDHAKHACRCALQSVKKLFELQKEYEKRGLPMIDLGIGLNTGEVSVGNMGSQTVRSYTVMGDAVNLASRLEGINKTYGTRIIISEFTYAQVKDDFICREVDWVRVKGKALPVKIFELMAEGKVQQAQPATQELLKWFQEGYLKYHEKAWSSALDLFTSALNLKPDDEVSKVYLTRCQEYLVEPPPDDWDGVFVMKTK